MSDMPDGKDVLGSEYVLGALDASEMAAVCRHAMSDPALAAAIADWERRLATLVSVIAAATSAGPVVADRSGDRTAASKA
jgi:anti-sigma-K factor RskA